MGEFQTPPHLNGEITLLRQSLDKPLPPRSYFELFRPDPALYLRPEAIGGIHGDSHGFRVHVWGHVLHQLLEKRGIEIDMEAASGFAGSHDTGRLSDEDDPEHGLRSASLVLDNRVGFVPFPKRDAVAYLNAWHVPEDYLAPRMTPVLAFVKDIDAVERCRDPEGALDPRFLRFPETRILVKPAKLLFDLGTYYQRQYGLDPFSAAVQASVDLGLVPDR